MRSKSRRPHPRLLVVCGRGFAATAVLDLLPLLTQAGFEPRVAFLEESPGWVPVEPVKSLSGASPFCPSLSAPAVPHTASTPPAATSAVAPDVAPAATPAVIAATTTAATPGTRPLQPLQPAWAGHADPFVATIALGLPRPVVERLAGGTRDHPVLDLINRRGGPVFLWMDGAEVNEEPLPELGLRGVLEVRILPKQPGRLRAAVERGFAEFIAARQRRAELERHSFLLRREVPAPLPSPAGSSPAWSDELLRRLKLAGLREADIEATNDDHVGPPDLLIDTCEGPFPTGDGATPLQISVTPPSTDGRSFPEARLRVRFLRPETPEETVREIVAQGTIVVVRCDGGDLTWHDPNGRRLLPELAERPALARLVELLADRLSASAA